MHPQVQTASQLKSLHLLRALLREASYLPDANARTYFRRHVVNRFRAYQPSWNATANADAQAVEKYRHRSAKRRHISIINDRTRAMQRKAQKCLNYLRRANLAEAPCLEKILLFTYGRIGKRKYALLEDLLRPDPAHAAAEPAPLQKLYHSNERYLSFFDAPTKQSPTHFVIDISDRYSRLKTVLRSQSQRGKILGRHIRRPHLLTPIHNIWERPMPIKRARNAVRKWYAETMTRLLPPLPNQEWDALLAMVKGEKWISFTKRRTPAVDIHPQPSQAEGQIIRRLQDALALDKPSRAERAAGSNSPKTLTLRSMRRLYAKLLAVCCKLEWNDEFSKWNVIWGSRLNRSDARLYTTPVDDSLFAGVDVRGRLIKELQPKCLAEKNEKRK